MFVEPCNTHIRWCTWQHRRGSCQTSTIQGTFWQKDRDHVAEKNVVCVSRLRQLSSVHIPSVYHHRT